MQKEIQLTDKTLLVDEIWINIKHYDLYYKISNKGRIIALERYATKNGKPFFIKEKELCKNDIKCGYKKFSYVDKGVYKSENLHRLIATHFIPNPENKSTVNHINGIKTDNRVENLEWCTYRENFMHAVDMGLINYIPKDKVRVGARGQAVAKICIQTNCLLAIYRSAAEAVRKNIGYSFGLLINIREKRKYKGFKWCKLSEITNNVNLQF